MYSFLIGKIIHWGGVWRGGTQKMFFTVISEKIFRGGPDDKTPVLCNLINQLNTLSFCAKLVYKLRTQTGKTSGHSSTLQTIFHNQVLRPISLRTVFEQPHPASTHRLYTQPSNVLTESIHRFSATSTPLITITTIYI